ETREPVEHGSTSFVSKRNYLLDSVGARLPSTHDELRRVLPCGAHPRDRGRPLVAVDRPRPPPRADALRSAAPPAHGGHTEVADDPAPPARGGRDRDARPDARPARGLVLADR